MRQLILFLLLGFTACSRQSNQEQNENKTTEPELNFGNGKSQNLGNDLWIKNVMVDTTNAGQRFQGISLHGQLEVSNEALEALHTNGYDAFFFNWVVKQDEKVLFNNETIYRSNINKQLEPNQLPFLSQTGIYDFTQRFPFAGLALPKGVHALTIYLYVFPVRYSSDDKRKHLKKLQYIGSESISNFNLDFQIQNPQLFKGKIKITYFEIDKNGKKKYDVTLNGKGHPDPFCEIESGNRVIFSSKPLKNTYKYDLTFETPTFLISGKDTITISFYDFDQGPFNSKDLISEWNGTFEDLQQSKPTRTGLIQKLNLQSDFEKY